MADSHAIRGRLARFEALVRAEIKTPTEFVPSQESGFALQVERGLVYPDALLREERKDEPYVGRLIELAGSPRLAEMLVIDASANQRPVYRPLLVYTWLRAFEIRYETLDRAQFGRWEEGLRTWCDLLEDSIGRTPPPAETIPAARGGEIAEAAWGALALYVAGKVFIRDAWTDLAGDWFGRIARAQRESGAFLNTGGSDNPEAQSYHELAILHAAATYAVRAEDRHVAGAVERATGFHLRETQPDHATTQPWGLFAFTWNEATASLAEGMLHALALRRSAGLDGVSLILLADSLYCLQLFL